MALPLGVLPAGSASADERGAPPAGGICDTSQAVFKCRARAQLDGDTLLIVSNAPSCSVVEWRLDGEPETTLIVDQGARIGKLDDPPRNHRQLRRRVTIEQCTEVRDTRVEPAAYTSRRHLPPGTSPAWAELSEAQRRLIEYEGKWAERRLENELRDSFISMPTHIPEPR